MSHGFSSNNSTAVRAVGSDAGTNTGPASRRSQEKKGAEK